MAEHRLGETGGTRGFERKDAWTPGILIVGAVIATAVVAASLVAAPFITWLTRPPEAVPVVPGMPERHGPPLLAAPEARLTELSRQDRARLTVLDWVDREQGLARIPITDAMDLLVERGWRSPPPRTPPRRMVPRPSRRAAPRSNGEAGE